MIEIPRSYSKAIFAIAKLSGFILITVFTLLSAPSLMMCAEKTGGFNLVN